MKTNLFLMLMLAFFAATASGSKKQSTSPVQTTITTEVLKDKIKGGWAGQVIGCTFGGPTEFQYRGTMIQDYQPMVLRKLFRFVRRCLHGPHIC